MVFILSSLLFLSTNIFAAKLPVLVSKQALDSLRYISKDGRTIYYQSKLGNLFITKNYMNDSIIDLAEHTQFLFESTLGGKTLITADESVHYKMSFLKNHKIYIHELGSKEVKLLGEGRNPNLELDGNWYSYYDIKDQSLNFKNIISDKVFSIKLKSNKNPYFFPSQLMLTENEIVYTDWNDDGHQVLYQYSKPDKKYTSIYKSKFANSNLEFCKIGTDIFIMDRGLFETDNGTQVIKVPIYGNDNFSKRETIYNSRLNDIGNLICKESKIYFIKTTDFDKELNNATTEVASINLKDSHKIEVISELETITQLSVLGDRILAKHDDIYYIVEGKNDATDDALDSK